jgi:hypothetical protein
MKHPTSIFAALLFVACAVPLAADVTVTSTTSGTGMAQVSGETVTHIKGDKMRSDVKMGDRVSTTIIDAAAGTMTTFDNQSKEAQVVDMKQMAQNEAVDMSGITASLTPNGQTKAIMGTTTSGYDLHVAVPVNLPQGRGMGGESVTMEMTGPVWIAKNAPGQQDWRHFFETASKNGMFLSNPGQGRAGMGQAGEAKGMAKIYEAIAQTGGVPYEMDITMKIGGTGQVAQMMGRMGGMATAVTTTVTNISTASIADSEFEVPAGYTIKK